MVCTHPSTAYFENCALCGSVHFPNHDLNFFEVLKLKPRYNLDLQALRARYFKLSQNIHPDKFFNKSKDEADKATRWFAQISKAYETLNAPLNRAYYLLSLHRSQAETNKKQTLPPDLALEYFELQEELEQDPRSPKTGEFLSKIDEQNAETLKSLENIFSKWEETGEDLFDEVANKLNYNSYLSSMRRDLENKWLR